MAKKPNVSGLTKKERKEYLKGFRSEEEKKTAKRSLWSKLIIVAIVVLVVSGIGYLITTADREASLLGEVIEEQGGDHVDPDAPPFAYNSNPPTSGSMWGQPAECGKNYNEPVADEAVLHSLEHGAVWITYKDKDDEELVGQLREVFEEESAKVILSPRSQNESAIAVASWTRLLKLDEFNKQQILDFIQSNRNNSPEPLAPC